MSDPRDHFATVNGVRLCYRTDGAETAPALFLVVGLGMQLTEWPEALVARLARHFRVIRADNRDMGLSQRMGPAYARWPEGFRWISRHAVPAPYHLADMADDLLALADHLGIERFACAGFSMGGMIVQHMALRAPGRISALASLCSADGNPVAAGTPENDALLERFFLLPEDREAQLDLYCESSEFYSDGLQPATSPATRAGAARLLDRMEAGGGESGGFLRQAMAITDSPDWDDRLGTLSLPALVVHGTADPCLPVALGQRAAARIPDARLSLHEGLGHWISDDVVKTLCDWLEGLPAHAGTPVPEQV
ncbi:alpha/beta hydrolase [Pseudooceanicola sp. CBS1P-1]|uniref:Alpha/beta fold hydrolase n=1 Tax=Pseudooceanicola albus TaxID=2692189 RepID=A0A6L7GA80_9RHOB|nr:MULTISPECIES: alpha/beta fold hydrolase [Pseudooceanicola]MBT9386346.1 alpha/beta hydrolase [Pseudooceanicola endophyticus]MXN20497.1 alpha/beta fold hydrolase [Pseudooceanicola albus]